MTSKCTQCGRFVSAAEGVKCNKCGSLFHRDCVKLSPNGPVPTKWSCHTCLKGKNKQSKVTATVTTPAPKISDTPNPSIAAVSATAENASMHDDSTNCIVSELRLLRSEMASFRSEIAQLNVTLSEYNSRVDSIEFRLSRLEEQSTSRESSEDGSVLSTISQLQSQLNDRDQELLMNDVKISGLHETPGENLLSLSCLLGKKLGVELDARDIVSAERTGPRRPSLTDTSQGDGVQGKPRSRPVVVRLARRAVRDELLRAARVRRGADSSGIVDGDPHRFYVNEHLTRANNQLFYKAREEGRNRNWRFVWTKGGRIYIRQTDKASAHRVRTEADLERLMNKNDSF